MVFDSDALYELAQLLNVFNRKRNRTDAMLYPALLLTVDITLCPVLATTADILC